MIWGRPLPEVAGLAEVRDGRIGERARGEMRRMCLAGVCCVALMVVVFGTLIAFVGR